VGVHYQQGLVVAERLQGIAEFDRNVGVDEPPALDALARGGFRSLGLGDDGDVGDEDGGLVDLVKDGTSEIRAAGQPLAILVEMKVTDNITLRGLFNIVGLLEFLDCGGDRVAHEEPARLARGI
jgi:hypothetical protein